MLPQESDKVKLSNNHGSDVDQYIDEEFEQVEENSNRIKKNEQNKQITQINQYSNNLIKNHLRSSRQKSNAESLYSDPALNEVRQSKHSEKSLSKASSKHRVSINAETAAQNSARKREDAGSQLSKPFVIKSKNHQLERLEKLKQNGFQQKNKFIKPRGLKQQTDSHQSSVDKLLTEEQADTSSIDRLQNWYKHKRTSNSPDQHISLSSQQPDEAAHGIEIKNMIDQYSRHVNGQNPDVFRQINGFARGRGRGMPTPNDNSRILNQMHGHYPGVPRSLGPLINVHQHFNQPNITNVNHNQYFVHEGITNEGKQLSSIQVREKNLKSMGQQARKGAKSGPNGGRRIMRRMYQNPTNNIESKTAYQNNVFEKVKESGRRSEADNRNDTSTFGMPKIKENLYFHEKSDSAQSKRDDSHNQTFDIVDLNILGVDGHQDYSTIDSAIKGGAQFFDLRKKQQRRKDFDLRMNHLSQISSNEGPPGKLKHRIVGVKKIYQQIGSVNLKDKSSLPSHPYNKSIKKMRELSPNKILQQGLDKEDYRDQLFLTKAELNKVQEELIKTKTRMAVLQEQTKSKDKFIDELIRSSQFMHNAILTGVDSQSIQDIIAGQTAQIKDLEKNSQPYKELVSNGPYSILKLKKKCQDLTELLQLKTIENDDLMKNIKHQKVVELQKTINLYSRECHRLKGIVSHVVDIAKKAGLEDKMSAEARDFYKTPSQQSLHKKVDLSQMESIRSKDKLEKVQEVGDRSESNSRESSKMLKKSSFGGESPAKDEKAQMDKMQRNLQNLQKDRMKFMELDKKKNEQIKKLEDKVAELKQIKKEPSRTKLDQKKMSRDDDTSAKEIQEKDRAVQELTAQKKQLELQLQQQANTLSELTTKLETQKKEHSWKESTNKENASQEMAKVQADYMKLKKEAEKHIADKKSTQEQLKEANASLETNKKAYLELQKQIKELHFQVENVQQTANNEKEEASKQIQQLKDQIKHKESLIQTLENKLKDLEAEVQKLKAHIQDSQKQIQALTKSSDIFKVEQVDHKPKPALAANRNRASTQAKPKNDKDSEVRKSKIGSDSFVTNSQLNEEINMIDHKINNVKESDFDERSDLGFSVLQSQVPGITASEISGVQPERFLAYQSPQLPKGNQPEPIKEASEHDEADFTRKHADFGEKNLTVESEDKSPFSVLKVDEPKQVKLLSVSEVPNQMHKLSVGNKDKPQPNKLLEQIDQIASESVVHSIFETNQTQFSKGSVKHLPFVEINAASVQLGFNRLGRLLQLRRCNLDQIEEVLLENKFRANQSVKIGTLSEILANKLQLSKEESVEFARFLIEEKDEEHPEIKTIEFDLNRQVNSQYIPVRLMTQFKTYPAVYSDQLEKDTVSKFKAEFGEANAKKLVNIFNSQENAIIEFDFFKEQVRQLVGNRVNDKDLDIAFIYLCRGPKSVDSLVEADLQEMIKGFDSQNAPIIFGDMQITVSDEYSEIQDHFIEVPKDKHQAPLLTGEVPMMQTILSGGDAKKEETEIYTEYSDIASKPIINQEVPAQTATFGDQKFLVSNPLQSSQQSKGERVMSSKKNSSERPKEGSKEVSFKAHSQVVPDSARYSNDRSDNSFDQQESLTGSAVEQFKFGKGSMVDHNGQTLTQKYADDDKTIIKEQSQENLLQPETPAVEQLDESGVQEQEKQKEQKTEDVEYYDEEEPKSEVDKQTSQHITEELILTKSEEKPVIEDKPLQAKEQVNEYEYYDEEDPEANEEQKIEVKGTMDTGVFKVNTVDITEVQNAIDSQLKESEIQVPSPDFDKKLQEEHQELQPPSTPSIKSATTPDQKPKMQLDDSQVQNLIEFTPEQIQKVHDEIRRVLERKIKEENLQQSLQAGHVTQLVITATQIFTMFGQYVLTGFSELKDSCRDIFREIIYTDVKKQNNGTETFKQEIEYISPGDLILKVEELIYPKQLTQGQQSCLHIIFSFVSQKSNARYTDIQNIMKAMEIVDYKTPKGQVSTAQLDYESLDNRSIRLINRMIHFLGSSGVSFSDFMKDIVTIQEVKTKSSSPQVEVFQAKKFFKLLAESEVKKNSVPHNNLCLFLCIDPKYKNVLMLKKLKRCIIDFNNSSYFQSIGLKKQKLTGDFEYYDEEDDDNGGVQFIDDSKQINSHIDASPDNQAAQYEYYDEEDDGNDANQNKNSVPQYNLQLPAQQIQMKDQRQVSQSPSFPSQQTTQIQVGLIQASQVNQDNVQYEYYDEEDDAAGADNTAALQQQQLLLQQMHQRQQSFGQSPSNMPSIQIQQQATNPAEQYEYYDEEDDQK